MFKFTVREVVLLLALIATWVAWWASRPSVRLPLGMDGYCPVTVLKENRWQLGSGRFSAVHEGRRYFFADETAKQEFLAIPEHYAPVCSGDDVVKLTLQNVRKPGERRFGIGYGDRIYLFESEDSLQTFLAEPKRFSDTAMR